MIPITKRVKGAQDMKKLQEKLIATQTQKKWHQAQMEPLQEWVAEVIAQAEDTKNNMAQT
jgi:hypothetical protein